MDPETRNATTARLGAITALLARAKRPDRPRPADAGKPWEIRNAAENDVEVWLYDTIGGWGIWADEFVQDLAQIRASQITVRLNSPGGDYFDGVAIANSLLAHPARVRVQVDGMAASIASVIALAGDEVVMGRGSQMMIHNASTLSYGQACDLRKTADLLDQISSTIAQLYADRTGTPVEDWQTQMDAETWFTADQAVTAGLADSVAAVPEREQHGHDPDETSDDGSLQERAAAAAARRTVHAQADHEPAVGRIAAHAAGPAAAVAEDGGRPTAAAAEDDVTPEGEPAEHPDAAVLGQALAWWTAIDQQADAALARIAVTLAVPNPDVDTDGDPLPLPAGVAGLAQVLGMLTNVDTIVDGAQVVMAQACGIPNPDPDADDDDAGEDGGPAAHSDAPPVTATSTTIAPTAGATDSPDTGAGADDWSALTSHLTDPSPDPDDAFAALRGALL